MTGKAAARYTYAPGYIDSPAVQERDLNSDGDFGDSGEVVYYHSNTLHSIYALTDGSENVVERCRSAKPSYGSFAWGETPPMMEGEPVVPDADPASEADTPSLKLRRASWSADADAASDAENPYRFTARRLDAESGLMQYRNRYYSVVAGRFNSRDPEGYADWFNLYCYVTDRVTLSADPLGLRNDFCGPVPPHMRPEDPPPFGPVPCDEPPDTVADKVTRTVTKHAVTTVAEHCCLKVTAHVSTRAGLRWVAGSVVPGLNVVLAVRTAVTLTHDILDDCGIDQTPPPPTERVSHFRHPSNVFSDGHCLFELDSPEAKRSPEVRARAGQMCAEARREARRKAEEYTAEMFHP